MNGVVVWQYHCIACGAWWEDPSPLTSTCSCADGGMWEADRIGPWPAHSWTEDAPMADEPMHERACRYSGLTREYAVNADDCCCEGEA